MSHHEQSFAGADRRWQGAAIAALLGALLATATPIAAQNLLANPHFHENALEWDLEIGQQILWTQLVEEGDCSNSGAALVVSEETDSGDIATIFQCLAIDDVTDLYAGARHLGYGDFSLEITTYTAFNCSTGILGFAKVTLAQSPVAWNDAFVSLSVPANANAASVRLSAVDDDPHGLSVDEVILTPRRFIFLDGFDGNDPGEPSPCRW